LARIDEIIAIHPRAILLSLGRNGGLSDTTNYITLVSDLQAAGITVIHLIEGYDAAWAVAGSATFIAFLNRHYSALSIIDGYTPILYCPDCIATDAVHLTTLGAKIFYETILRSNLIARGTYTNPFYGSVSPDGIVLGSTEQNGLTTDANATYNSTSGLTILNAGTFHKDQNANTFLSVINSTNGSSAGAGLLVQSDAFTTEPFQFATSHSTSGVLCAGCGGVYSNGLSLSIYNDRTNGKISFDAGSSSSEQMQLNALGHFAINTASEKTKMFALNGGMWMNKDSAATSSVGSVMNLGIDTVTGFIVKNVGGGGGGSVASVFGRTGTVVAATNDYSFSQISGSVADGQLSSNVPLKNATNTFSVGQTITDAGGVTAGLNINSTGSTSYSSLTLGNNLSHTGQLFFAGGSYSPVGILSPDGLGFYGNGAGGIDIWADNNGPIKFSALATTGAEGFRLTTGNALCIGATAASGSELLRINGGVKADGQVSIGGIPTNGWLTLLGNRTFSSGTGAQSYFSPATYTDGSTVGSGTLSTFIANYIGTPTLTATNTGITTTKAYNFYVDVPTAQGTHETITDSYSAGFNGPITVAGNIVHAVQGVSGNTTLNKTGDLVTVTAAGGNVTPTLPDATLYPGLIYTLVRTDASANTCTVGTTSGQNINGSTTFSLTAQYKSVTVWSNGTQWYIKAQN
jgi:hypothetical protein